MMIGEGSGARRDRAGGGRAAGIVDSTFRVLLVDDEPLLLETMRAVLEPDFDVTACASSRAALELLGRESFHVICADWQMPGMDGVKFFQRLARRSILRHSGCILITAHADALLEQVAWSDRKMLGFLRKPFRPSELVERVAHFASVAQMKRSTSELVVAVSRAAK